MSRSGTAGCRGAAADAAGAARHPRSCRCGDHRDFRRYWVARQVSIAGTLVTAVALPVLVYRLSGSPSLTALITVVEGVPYLLFGLFSGALSDRLDRRRVMVVADVVAGLTIASVPVAFCARLADRGARAGRRASSPRPRSCSSTVPRSARCRPSSAATGSAQANSALWGFGSLLDLGVPMLAGVLLAVVHPATLLGIDALSFLLSAACVASIRSRLSPERSGVPPLRPRVLLAEVAVGLRFLWGHAGVRSQTVVGFLLSLSGAGFMSLSVPYADLVLGVGTSGWRFGLVFAAWGVGGILVAVLTPRLLRVTSPNRLSLLWLPVAGVAGVVVATTTTWAVAVAVMVVWGVSYQGVVLNSMTYRQQVTPEPLLGRVNTAGRMLSFGVGWTCGALGASALAGLIGLQPALVPWCRSGWRRACSGGCRRCAPSTRTAPRSWRRNATAPNEPGQEHPERMADSTQPRSMAIPLTAFAAGAVVALLVGIFGRVHDPTLADTTTLGFRTVIDMKVVLSVAIGVLAVLQVIGALWMYGKLGVTAPSWLGTAHRISGAIAVVLILFVSYHCVWTLGLASGTFADGRARVDADGRARHPRLRGHRCAGGQGGRGAVQARARVVPARGRRPALRAPHRRGDDIGRLVHRRQGLAGLGWLRPSPS